MQGELGLHMGIGYIRVCRILSGYTGVYRDKNGYTWVFDIQGYVGLYWGIVEIRWKRKNMNNEMQAGVI